MSENRVDRKKAASHETEPRSIFRRRVLKAGTITYGLKSRAIDCTITEISDIGAVLRIDDNLWLPETVTLIIPTEGFECKSRIVKRESSKIWIEFTGEQKQTSLRKHQSVRAGQPAKNPNYEMPPSATETDAISGHRFDILIVDDAETDLRMLELYASRLEHSAVRTFNCPLKTSHWIANNQVDLILLDYQMPVMNGIELMKKIKATPEFSDVPIVIITGQEDRSVLLDCLREGASDFLRKPVDPVELLARCTNLLNLRERQFQLQEANKKLLKLATTDPLTGLPNRRYFMEKLEAELARYQRYGRPFSVSIVDIDRLKMINDSLGHLAGDAAIKKVGQLLADNVRDCDCVARIGGDEFACLFPETELEQAQNMLDRFRSAPSASPNGEAQLVFGVSASTGLAEAKPSDEIPDDILVRADEALYAEKATNRIDKAPAHQPRQTPSDLHLAATEALPT